MSDGGITVMSYDRTEAVEWEEFEVENQAGGSKEVTPVKKHSIEQRTSDASGFK